MSYYNFGQQKKRRSTMQSTLRVIGFIVGILILWLIVQRVFIKKATKIPVGSETTIYNTMMPKSTLVDRINELQTTLNAYNAEIENAKLVSTENDRLKEELGRLPIPAGTLAHVITLPNRSFYDTFVIDAGTDQNIEVGQTVYAFNSIAIGTISSVESNISKVLLFSAPGRNTAGTAAGTDVAVTLIGRGGGEYEVRIPRDLQFEVNGIISYQSVHTSTLAQIERIATDPRDPFQRLIAKAPVNLQALKWVIVR